MKFSSEIIGTSSSRRSSSSISPRGVDAVSSPDARVRRGVLPDGLIARYISRSRSASSAAVASETSVSFPPSLPSSLSTVMSLAPLGCRLWCEAEAPVNGGVEARVSASDEARVSAASASPFPATSLALGLDDPSEKLGGLGMLMYMARARSDIDGMVTSGISQERTDAASAPRRVPRSAPRARGKSMTRVCFQGQRLRVPRLTFRVT